MVKPLPRLRLQGFNNLTKALSFNIYDVCYAASAEERSRYIEYIDEAHNAERLNTRLRTWSPRAWNAPTSRSTETPCG